MLRILMFSFLLPLWLFSSSLKELNNLSKEQYDNLVWIYQQGKKYDLEFTLTAIAWQESKFGKYPINLSDPSGGLFHNLLGSVCCRLSLTPNQWNQSRILERLVGDREFALQQAIAELHYWENYWKVRRSTRIWSYMVMSYNGGHRGSKKYLKEIKRKIRILRIFFKRLEDNPTFK